MKLAEIQAKIARVMGRSLGNVEVEKVVVGRLVGAQALRHEVEPEETVDPLE